MSDPQSFEDWSYDRVAEQWDAARRSLVNREREYLDLLLDRLEPGSAVLDLGCGTGRPMAEYVIEQGHRVTGVDWSSELLAKARSRFPTHDWQRSRLEEFPFDRQYAAAICWDAIFHVERKYHEPIIRGMANSLPAGGRIMLSTGGSENPPFTDMMFGHEFFYDSHPPTDALAIVSNAGFRILVTEFTNPPTAGRDKGKLAIVAEKVAAG